MQASPAETAIPETMTGVRKAAIFLISLGEKASADIIRQLPENELKRVSTEITRLDRSISPEQSEAVLEEFQKIKTTGESSFRGGADYANKMLTTALGAAPASQLMEKITGTTPNRADQYANALRDADPQQLAAFLQNEHPQTIALILSNLTVAQGGALLMSLPDAMRPAITMRMANLDRISPEVFNRIAAVVGQKLKSLGEVKHSGGAQAVAELLNALDSRAVKDILSAVAQTDTPLAESIQRLMFAFEDILSIPKEAMKALVSRIDRKVLTLALKGTSAELKNQFTQCMSQRGAEMLNDDMEALGPQRIKDVESAQQQIVAAVRQLQAEGVLNLKGASDQYVV